MDVRVVGGAEGPSQPAPPVAAPQAGISGALPDGIPQTPTPKTGEGALSSVVAKLFGDAGAPKPVQVNVSYRVEHDPNMIVTVFSDPTTGREIAQMPAEILVQIAQFFDKQQGVTVDRSA